MSTNSDRHKQQAHALAHDFSQRHHPQAFRGMNRIEVFDALDERIDHPHLIYQGHSGLCGPSAILYNYALHDRVGYTQGNRITQRGLRRNYWRWALSGQVIKRRMRTVYCPIHGGANHVRRQFPPAYVA